MNKEISLDEYLYNYVMNNHPMLREEDVEEYYSINEYDLLIKFKNGRKVIYDTFANNERLPSKNREITEDDMKKEFGRILQRMMNRKFISQEELAECIGTSQTMISHYISGRYLPNMLMLKKIATVLKCSTEDFYYKEY